MVDRIPPHDTDAEEALIGALILAGEVKLANVKSADFYSERNAWIFETCEGLYRKNVSINQITLAHELGDKITNIGGPAYLSHCVSVCPTHLDLPFYADIVRKMSLKRKIIDTAARISDMGYEATGDINTDLALADGLFVELRRQSTTMDFFTPEDRVKLMNEHYTKLNEKGGGIAVSTGLTKVDHILSGGFLPGDFIVIGSRTGMGKTTILQTISNNIGLRGQNVAYFTCEMSVQSLSDRDVAGYLGKPIGIIRRGDYENQQEGLYTDITGPALEYLRKLRVFYRDVHIDTDTIRRVSQAIQLRHGLTAIVVDYLGLLKDNQGHNEEQRLTNVSHALKQMSMELKVPIITAHQINRSPESRDDKRPLLSDLRGSGSIESDADVVLLLFRENYYKEIEDKTTEVIIAKQRQGPSNKTVRVYFDEKHLKYCDLSQNPE